MHFLAYMVLDKRLAFDVIVEDVFKRWFITIGMAALVVLLSAAGADVEPLVDPPARLRAGPSCTG
jgi:hypothetical protein